MRPELFQEFCAEYTREINRLRMERTATIRAQEAELAKVTRELDKLIDALIQGVPADRIKQRMAELEARRHDLQQQVRQTTSPEPYLHPNMAETYRRKVADLARSISSETGSAKAALETIRSLIESVVVTPEGEIADHMANTMENSANVQDRSIPVITVSGASRIDDIAPDSQTK